MRISFYFEPRDLWIGVFWRTYRQHLYTGKTYRSLTLYICILPTAVIEVQMERET